MFTPTPPPTPTATLPAERAAPLAWVAALLAVVVAVLGLVVSASWPGALAGSMPLTPMSAASRDCGGVLAQVRLPDDVERMPGAAATAVGVDCLYRLDVAQPPPGSGLFIPGLVAHALVSVNGQVLMDTLGDTLEDTLGERPSAAAKGALPPLPQRAERIVRLQVPDAAWQAGSNRIEIRAAGARAVLLSRVYLGPMAEVRRQHLWRMLGVVVGPSLVAAVIGTLGLCMLMLWSRRRDPLDAYFGIGTLSWAGHTFWTVSPWPLLAGVHVSVWWTALYAFWVCMLVIFCTRFARWHWPRFERGVWAFALATPVVLYAAAAADQLDNASSLWRLLLIGLVAVGVAAVLRASMQQPSIDRWLVAASGVVSLLFAAHDWSVSQTEGGDNPVYLVPYAGVVFVLFVMRMLIDRYVSAAGALEQLNTRLEQRVAEQGLALTQAVDDMRAARDAAEDADRAKTRFLAAASHDLRQPAHALSLYMAALRSEPLPPPQEELVQRMSGSLSALESMFSLLLDISQIEGGGLVPAPEVFEIAPLLRRLAEEFAPQLEARGLRLGLRLPPAGTPCTCSDPVLVERVLRNLIANAAKYTEQGGVLIACRLRTALPATPARPGTPPKAGPAEHTRALALAPQWRIEIWDSGVGIAEADRTRVFEEFFQADNPGRDRARGLGLGLSIVRRLVRLLGLSIELRSRLGHGSCFALRLPQAAPLAALTAGADAGPGLASVEGMTVGLIEDDLAVRDAMRLLLRRWGCRVAEGADADELQQSLQALQALQTPQASGDGPPHPDVLLVDHRLQAGRHGGGEALRLFERWGTRVPLLVLSGEAQLQPLREGGQACMAKPVSPTLFRQWLAANRPAPPAANAAKEPTA